MKDNTHRTKCRTWTKMSEMKKKICRMEQSIARLIGFPSTINFYLFTLIVLDIYIFDKVRDIRGFRFAQVFNDPSSYKSQNDNN